MNQTTRQELLVSLLKAIKDSSAETKKQLANELYLSASELDDLLYELIKERTHYVKTRSL
jgi:hypothetical protein